MGSHQEVLIKEWRVLFVYWGQNDLLAGRGRVLLWRSNCRSRYYVLPGRHCIWRKGGPLKIYFYKQYGLDMWLYTMWIRLRKAKESWWWRLDAKHISILCTSYLRSSTIEEAWDLVLSDTDSTSDLSLKSRMIQGNSLNLRTAMNLGEMERIRFPCRIAVEWPQHVLGTRCPRSSTRISSYSLLFIAHRKCSVLGHSDTGGFNVGGGGGQWEGFYSRWNLDL